MAINKNYVPKLYMSTANMTVKEWEDARRNSLGGSDMAVIMGLSPYESTRRDIYYQKIGKVPVAQQDATKSIIFNSGHFLENMVANLFSYRTGYEAYEIKAMFEHPLYPFLRGNIDRFFRTRWQKEPIGFLECKTSSEYNSSEWDDNEIPIQYKIQISTYLSILNMERCMVSCLFIPESLRWVAGILYQMKFVIGSLSKNCLSDIYDQLKSNKDTNIEPFVPMVISALGGEMLIPKHLLQECSEAIGNRFVIREFYRDEVLEEMLLAEAENFWNKNVLARVEPSLKREKGNNAIKTLEKYIPTFSVSKPVSLPDGENLAIAAQKISELKAQKTSLSSKSRAIDHKIEKLSVPFIEALNGADYGQFECDGKVTSVTYKSSSTRKSISKENLEKLKNVYPDAYDEFVTEKSTKPSLKIGR